MDPKEGLFDWIKIKLEKDPGIWVKVFFAIVLALAIAKGEFQFDVPWGSFLAIAVLLLLVFQIGQKRAQEIVPLPPSYLRR